MIHFPSFRRKPETIFSYSEHSWMPFFNGMTFRDGIAEKIAYMYDEQPIHTV
ncbi:MAG: hypothetical protein GX556_10775 [Fibrobacter sp.]|nr:hypothetical protein [Fibrobacter sp.]